MKQGARLATIVLATLVLLDAVACQNTTSRVMTHNCSQVVQNEPKHSCGRCKTVKQELFMQGDKPIKSHTSCTECTTQYVSDRYFEFKVGDKEPDSFSFDQFCNRFSTTFWVWFWIVISLVLITAVTLFFLRGKLPCFSQKRALDTDATLTSG